MKTYLHLWKKSSHHRKCPAWKRVPQRKASHSTSRPRPLLPSPRWWEWLELTTYSRNPGYWWVAKQTHHLLYTGGHWGQLGKRILFLKQRLWLQYILKSTISYDKGYNFSTSSIFNPSPYDREFVKACTIWVAGSLKLVDILKTKTIDGFSLNFEDMDNGNLKRI